QELVVEQFLPYWRRLRRQLGVLLNDEQLTIDTVPKQCDHCEYCEYNKRCTSQWRAEDSLVYVAGTRQRERDAMETVGVRTVVQLAERRDSVPSMSVEKLSRLSRQAEMQVRSRDDPSRPPVFELIEPTDDPVYGHGFNLLPAPDDGDVFFDFEGHPFWTPKNELLFLSGLYFKDENGKWIYDERWAHDLSGQQGMITGLIEFFAERRRAHPGMHVYHYNHTEKSSMERLIRDSDEEYLFGQLINTGLFVDLFLVAKNAVRVGTESYGLKDLEHVVEFVRSGGIEQGAGAVVEYEKYMESKDEQLLRNIAAYNRDDVASTMTLRDWLVMQRPNNLEWREAFIEYEQLEFDTDELVAQLRTFDEGSPQHLLADLLGYWRRERFAYTTEKFSQANSEFTSLYDNEEFIADLELVRVDERPYRDRIIKTLVMTWPEQPVDSRFADTADLLYTGVGVEHGYATCEGIDLAAREVRVKWGAYQEEKSALPVVIAKDKNFRPEVKARSLKSLAELMLIDDVDNHASRLALSLLTNERPRFESSFGPEGGVFTDDLGANVRWVGHLDESFVAIQGPPGAGKTYSGSHLIHELIRTGKRVGVVATSHSAIDNLMNAAYGVVGEAGELEMLNVLRWDDVGEDNDLAYATYGKKKKNLEGNNFNLIGGTAWLWASESMRANPVDVLMVDEAGQFSLADAVASAPGARNMILLGDPLQLGQVSNAVHPGGSGASVLQHVLCDAATIPSDQGVFISQSWRMHPDVCHFISQQIYEGRLTSEPDCARQDTEFGTGLRWLRAVHQGNTTRSPEEVDLVAGEILDLFGTRWIDRDGNARPLDGGDFMVVAPYNDQVDLLRSTFDADPQLRTVRVGTVDKFQGKEAPVVFFTMTTSAGDDVSRGAEFLFSRNRLNVA
ncbi:MAG: TM0106 family RecB-like putative nuclease, partial [Acidimicrobiales bacterium]